MRIYPCYSFLRQDSEGRWTHLLYTVLHPTNMVYAYEQIQANPGLMTPAITPETLLGISKERLAHISSSLLKGTFQFAPMRRIYVPKPNSKEKRPITISSPIDRIVHRSVANVLETIFERIFLPVSYGFRPFRNTHSFFAEVQQWKGIKRIIHADVRKCFDQIEHSMLIRLLEKHIADPLFVELIRKFLSTPILDKKGTNYTSIHRGIPQGAVFSPLLMNVVLHELDVFALSICKKRDLKYGRFADDCTLGTGVNSDSLALETLTQFSQFLQSELGGLSFRVKLIKKTGCILGANFVLPSGNQEGGAVRIEVPMERVKYRLTQKGFMQPNKTFLLGLGKDPVSISDRYKLVALGLLRYYGPCKNIGNLICLIQTDLFHSLCKALGILTGILPKDVPKRLSSAVSIYLNDINLEIVKINEAPPFFKFRKKDKDIESNRQSGGRSEENKQERKKSVLFRPCACRNCKDTDVSIFQVRQIRDYLKIVGGPVVKSKGRYFGGLAALRKVISRKRIPLCHNHFMMMERRRLRFSNLAITEKFHSCKVLNNNQEFFEQKTKPRKSRRSR